MYDDISDPVACFHLTIRIVNSNSVLFETTRGIYKLPGDNFCDIEFPIQIQDLSLDSRVDISLWSTTKLSQDLPVASTTFKIFSNSTEGCDAKSSQYFSKHSLRQGTYKLLLWPDALPDLENTPGLLKSYRALEEVYYINNIMERYEQGLYEKVPWLDSKSIPAQKLRIKGICEETNVALLEIGLPTFRYPVIYEEKTHEVEDRKSDTFSNLFMVADYEINHTKVNPVAEQYLRLVKEQNKNDRDLRPTHEIKEKLIEIISLPDHVPLEPEQRMLLWTYRYYLLKDKCALTKFLHSVNWEIEDDEKHALEIMREWAPIDKEDALHLLSAQFSCKHFANILCKGFKRVREYAVDRLENCTDEELEFILLQLVQALRYEDIDDSTLSKFLIRRSERCHTLAINLYWYLTVECQCTTGPITVWYKQVFSEFLSTLHDRCPSTLDLINLQVGLKDKLSELASAVKRHNGDFESKKKKLRQFIAKGGEHDLSTLSRPIPCPINPEIMLTGVVSEKSTLFLSKMIPMKLTFTTLYGGEIELMYKNGDDLRQDQLVIQIIRLMDRLLKSVNLDMGLTPYNVIATSVSDGFVEFVPNSQTIYDQIRKKKLISQYLLENRKNNSDIENTFIKSCAGYCVITYLLGIGDRHLENLLIDHSGHLFHIDFGYILGKDPKPMPPPMKLCKEMVEGMGGERSPGYDKFKVKCIETFMHLRKHCKLTVNLFYLMIHSGLSVRFI
jgi:phosphatidylinositol 3-kinase